MSLFLWTKITICSTLCHFGPFLFEVTNGFSDVVHIICSVACMNWQIKEEFQSQEPLSYLRTFYTLTVEWDYLLVP